MTVLSSAQAATLGNVASATSSTSLFAASRTARKRLVWNDSTSVLYVKFGTAASATSCTVAVPAGALYEFPEPVYAGVVEGVWASVNGNARVTEY